MLENIDNWEVVVIVGYQVTVLTVFFFLVGAFLGMALTGIEIVNGQSSVEATILTTIQMTFNYIATLFMFVGSGIITTGVLLNPDRNS